MADQKELRCALYTACRRAMSTAGAEEDEVSRRKEPLEFDDEMDEEKEAEGSRGVLCCCWGVWSCRDE